VADLRRRYQDRDAIPALYGCRGLVDIGTIEGVMRANSVEDCDKQFNRDHPTG
jgi:hypothetical protein